MFHIMQMLYLCDIMLEYSAGILGNRNCFLIQKRRFAYIYTYT